MQDRAIRRHHSQRMKARARRLFPGYPNAARNADHLAVCSCWMCGNSRHHIKGMERLTIQERRENAANISLASSCLPLGDGTPAPADQPDIESFEEGE